MSERTSYPNGVPSWIDVATPDVDATVAFYGGLFGWEPRRSDPVEDMGGYGMFTLRGKDVAGFVPLRDDTQPAVWSTYVAVDDADATVAAAGAAGGQVAMAVLDVMDAGRMAFLIDPPRALVASGRPAGTAARSSSTSRGRLGWNELTTRDVEAAAAFYASVFGWEPEAVESGGEYTVFNLGAKAIAGMMRMDERWPEGIPSHWMTYFVVADTDASAARALKLGGSVAVPAFDAEGIGRIAVLDDPNSSRLLDHRAGRAPTSSAQLSGASRRTRSAASRTPPPAGRRRRRGGG